jgi:Uma2 family endonuclease
MVATAQNTMPQTMTLEEYLSLSFPDSEREPEFVRDHLEEKPMPDDTHSAIQFRLARLLGNASERLGREIHGRPERRVRLKNSVRVPDLLIYSDCPGPSLVTAPPLAVFEILSPGEDFAGLAGKLSEYLEWGAQYVFAIEPRGGLLHRFGRKGFEGIDVIEIPELDFQATINDLLPRA